MTSAVDIDPFAQSESRPAVSFHDSALGQSLPVGTTFVLRTEGPAKLAQTINWNTKKPEFWVNDDGTQGNPKMAAVVEVTLNGEARSLWAPKTSKKAEGSMFNALVDAQVKAGTRIGKGGTLTVRLTGLEPSEKGHPRKLYAAVYEGPDAFADSTPQAPAAPAVPAPAAENGGQVLQALRAKLSSLKAAGLEPGQIAAVPGVVGLDGKPMDAATVAALLSA